MGECRGWSEGVTPARDTGGILAVAVVPAALGALGASRVLSATCPSAEHAYRRA